MTSPMKLFSFALMLSFALVLTTWMASDAVAQRPFERIQKGWDDIRPRGRILREIFGEDDKEAKRKEKAESEQQAQQKRKAQKSSRGQVKSRNQRGPQPTPANATRSMSPSRQSAKAKTAAKPKHPSRLEFLVTESKKPEGLLVKKIDSGGAAYLGGIRKGDIVLSVGGMAVTAKEDIASITEVMKDGDQIEFEVARRGKKQKLLVQFGDPPSDETEAGETAPTQGTLGDVVQTPSVPSRSRGGSSSMRSVLNNGQTSSRAPQVPPRNSRPVRSTGNQNWPVQPPAASGARSIPPVQSASSRPSMVPAIDQKIREMSRQLERQRLEIEKLRQQLQQNREGQSGSSEIDPLLDFDSDR